MTKQISKIIVLSSILAVFSLNPGFAQTFEGTIEGADCLINHTNCVENRQDPHLSMERNFVLVTANGDYFFLPNLHRSIKARHFKEAVRVSGRSKGKTIRVQTLDVKTANGYRCIWDWEEIQADLASK